MCRAELEEGSGLQISKLAWGLVLGLLALMGPILKLERPTLAWGRPSLGDWKSLNLSNLLIVNNFKVLVFGLKTGILINLINLLIEIFNSESLRRNFSVGTDATALE